MASAARVSGLLSSGAGVAKFLRTWKGPGCAPRSAALWSALAVGAPARRGPVTSARCPVKGFEGGNDRYGHVRGHIAKVRLVGSVVRRGSCSMAVVRSLETQLKETAGRQCDPWSCYQRGGSIGRRCVARSVPLGKGFVNRQVTMVVKVNNTRGWPATVTVRDGASCDEVRVRALCFLG